MKEFFLLLCFTSLACSEDIQVRLVEQWPNGFKMKFSHVMNQSVYGGWKMSLKFTKPIAQLQFPNAQQISSINGSVFCRQNWDYNANLNDGQTLQMEFTGVKAKNNEAAPVATLELHPGKDAECDLTPSPTINPPGATPPVQETSKAELFEVWPNGFKMNISVLMKQKVDGGWEMTLSFPISVDALQTPKALQKSVSEDRKVYALENRQHNAFLAKCSRLEMIIIGQKTEGSEAPTEADVQFRRKENWADEGDGEPACIVRTAGGYRFLAGKCWIILCVCLVAILYR